MSASRTTEQLGGRLNQSGVVFQVMESYNGPSSYTAGGNTFTSNVLRSIDRAQVIGPTTSGFIGQVVTGSVSGNSFKVQFFVPAQVTGGGTGEVAGTTNLSAHGFYVLEEGR